MSARTSSHHRAPFCAIIGAGPAGSGVLASLLKEGLRAGDVDVVDPLAPLQAGTLAQWAIASDTTATKLAAQIPDALPQWRARLAALGDGSAPLALAGAALRAKADWAVRRSGARHHAARALSLAATPDGWCIVLSNGDTLLAPSVVLALGGVEVPTRAGDALASLGLPPRETLLSSALFRAPPPAFPSGTRVAILGGSHSAMAAAGHLLAGETEWDDGAVSLLHRSPPRVTHASVEAARKAGADFAPSDVCPHTGRVFALGGFRLDSAQLLRRIRSGQERRVRLLPWRSPAARDAARRADVVVSALGYAPSALPVTINGQDIEVSGVDRASRALDPRGRAIPGLWRVGLAAGLALSGRFGEPGFRGQANGLALWHNEVGADVARGVLAHVGQPA